MNKNSIKMILVLLFRVDKPFRKIYLVRISKLGHDLLVFICDWTKFKSFKLYHENRRKCEYSDTYIY